MLYSAGSAKLSFETAAILMCKEMKWDYYTYLSQPTWLIDGINILFRVEGEYSRAKAKERKNKS